MTFEGGVSQGTKWAASRAFKDVKTDAPPPVVLCLPSANIPVGPFCLFLFVVIILLK